MAKVDRILAKMKDLELGKGVVGPELHNALVMVLKQDECEVCISKLRFHKGKSSVCK